MLIVNIFIFISVIDCSADAPFLPPFCHLCAPFLPRACPGAHLLFNQNLAIFEYFLNGRGKTRCGSKGSGIAFILFIFDL